MWFTNLKGKLDAYLEEANEGEIKEQDNKIVNQSNEAVEEILELTREQFKILRNPEALLPADYLTYIFKNYTTKTQLNPAVVRDLNFGLKRLKNVISEMPKEVTFENIELDKAMLRLERAVNYLLDRDLKRRNLFDE